MPATQLATKSMPEDPLDSAEADQEVAAGDVYRLTAKIKELRKKGPGADPPLLAQLQGELESAQKIQRRTDLQAAETVAADGAPISAKALGKIRNMRQKAETLHSTVMSMMSECQRFRERVGALKGQIAALRASWGFKQSQREVPSVYLFPPRRSG